MTKFLIEKENMEEGFKFLELEKHAEGYLKKRIWEKNVVLATKTAKAYRREFKGYLPGEKYEEKIFGRSLEPEKPPRLLKSLLYGN